MQQQRNLHMGTTTVHVTFLQFLQICRNVEEEARSV